MSKMQCGCQMQEELEFSFADLVYENDAMTRRKD